MSEKNKILLVEDDTTLADWVAEYLSEQGFKVKHIARGDLVINAAKQFEPNIVLLDVMIPGINGIEVCRLLRQCSQVPIIMLTARADEFDEVIGLEAGASDYVIKPVRPRALLARINNILKSHSLQSNTHNLHHADEIIHGDLAIYTESKRVVYQGQEISLTTNLFDFLLYLAKNSGQVVGRDQVFRAIKGREYDGSDRRFDVMLSSLRKLFKDDPQNPKKFKTIWGKGYLFVADAW